MGEVTEEFLALQEDFIREVMGEVQCSSCKHYQSRNICAAFPGGIPLEIVSGEHDHRQPFEGDGGLRYRNKKADSS